MATSDIVSISIIAACGLLGMKGCFKWVTGMFMGLLVGCVILGIIGIAGKYTWSGDVGEFFGQGTVAPYAGQQAENVVKGIGVRIDGRSSNEGSWAGSVENN